MPSRIGRGSRASGRPRGPLRRFRLDDARGGGRHRGNCHDNAVAESFFHLLKRKCVRRKIYLTRDDARADMFDYIELFYNPKRRHGANGGLAPVEYEKRFRLSGVASV